MKKSVISFVLVAGILCSLLVSATLVVNAETDLSKYDKLSNHYDFVATGLEGPWGVGASIDYVFDGGFGLDDNQYYGATEGETAITMNINNDIDVSFFRIFPRSGVAPLPDRIANGEFRGYINSTDEAYELIGTIPADAAMQWYEFSVEKRYGKIEFVHTNPTDIAEIELYKNALDLCVYQKSIYKWDFAATAPAGVSGSSINNLFDNKIIPGYGFYGPDETTITMDLIGEKDVRAIRIFPRNEPTAVALTNRIANGQFIGYDENGDYETIGTLPSKVVLNWYTFLIPEGKPFKKIEFYCAGNGATDIGEIELYQMPSVDLNQSEKLGLNIDFTFTAPEALYGTTIGNLFDGKYQYPNDYNGPEEATITMTLNNDVDVNLVRIFPRYEPNDVSVCGRISNGVFRGYTDKTNFDVIATLPDTILQNWYTLIIDPTKHYKKIEFYHNGNGGTDIGEIELYKVKKIINIEDYTKLTPNTDFTFGSSAPKGAWGSTLEMAFDGKWSDTGVGEVYYYQSGLDANASGDDTNQVTITMNLAKTFQTKAIRVMPRTAIPERIANAQFRGYTDESNYEVIATLPANPESRWYEYEVDRAKKYTKITFFREGSTTDVGEIELYGMDSTGVNYLKDENKMTNNLTEILNATEPQAVVSCVNIGEIGVLATVAIYDENGNLFDVFTEFRQINGFYKNAFSIKTDISGKTPEQINQFKIKIFVWENEKMIPLANFND